MLSTTQPPILGDLRRAEVEHSGRWPSTIGGRKSHQSSPALNGGTDRGAIEGMRQLLSMVIALGCSACSWKDENGAPAPVSEGTPRLVGRVASIPAGADFLLIEAYGPWRVPEGGLLLAVGSEGRTANLVATGEELGRHVAADVRSGEAKVGDSVYYRPIKDSEGPSGESSPASGDVAEDSGFKKSTENPSQNHEFQKE